MSTVLITLLLVASVALNMWFFKRKPRSRNTSARSTMIQGIRNVKELATIRQSFQSIVMHSDAKSLLGLSLPGTERRFILKYSGTLACGNDLSQIRMSECFAVNRIRVVVPRSRILDIYPDMTSVRVYDQRAGLFASVRLEDQNREIALNLEEVRREALEGDILRRADENARLVLLSLAASLGLEAEVLFEDEERESEACGTVLNRVLPIAKTAAGVSENLSLLPPERM